MSDEVEVYEEVEIEEMDHDEDTDTYTYACPCGDLFRITFKQLKKGENIATCETCSLKIRVLFDLDELE